MTQYGTKLLSYLNEQSKSGKLHFTATSVFLESGIDFGDIDMITRVVDDLISEGKVEKTNHIGYGFKLI